MRSVDLDNLAIVSVLALSMVLPIWRSQWNSQRALSLESKIILLTKLIALTNESINWI